MFSRRLAETGRTGAARRLLEHTDHFLDARRPRRRDSADGPASTASGDDQTVAEHVPLLPQPDAESATVATSATSATRPNVHRSPRPTTLLSPSCVIRS